MLFVFIALVIVCFCLYKSAGAQHPERNQTAIAFTGPMASGKTFLGTKIACAWYNQRVFRWVIKRYVFMQKVEKPLLLSNIPLQYKKGKYSEVLTADHVLRKIKIPENSVIFIDEIGQFASQWDFNNPYVREQLSTLVRFARHWFNGKIIMTDQSVSNIIKYVRERLGIIYQLTEFKRYLRVTPFFIVNCVPLLMTGDGSPSQEQAQISGTTSSGSQTTLNVPLPDIEKFYFFGYLGYNKNSKARRYNSRAYKPIYIDGAVKEPVNDTKNLTSRYLLDLSCPKDLTKLYAADPKTYKEWLYKPLGSDDVDLDPVPLPYFDPDLCSDYRGREQSPYRPF